MSENTRLDIDELTIQDVGGGHFRLVRSQTSNAKLASAYAQVKADTKKLETAVDNDVTTLTPAMVRQILSYLLALGRLVIALSIKVNNLEKRV